MRLVICDDHRLLLEALATALANRGYTIEAATTTPDEAVRAVALHDPDILLVDVTFPVGSGLDAARQVIALHPGTKVVMLTGSEQAAPVVQALELGVAGYVRKAQRVEAIADALERVAAGELAIDRQLLRGARQRDDVAPATGPLDTLTPQERRVLDLLVEGRNTKEMVMQLNVSHSTVRTHVQNILAKLGVHSRLQAVAAVAADDLRPVDVSHAPPG